MIPNDFAIFILSYKRSENIHTLKTLKKVNYSGKVYIITDTSDPTLNQYKSKYGNKVLTFNKEDYRGKFDLGDNNPKNNTVAFARNAAFTLAKSIGITYFLVLDDDYTGFDLRFHPNLKYQYKIINKIDGILLAFLDFYKSTNIKTICFAQGGDFIGGDQGTFGKAVFLKRKAMNSFFCSTERPFTIIGRGNDDVNTYVVNGSRGDIYFTSNLVSLNQKPTQTNSGGLTEQYKDDGTYQKSFYTIMMHPSSVTIKEMGNKDMRIHHAISWKHTVPKILREKVKKQ